MTREDRLKEKIKESRKTYKLFFCLQVSISIFIISLCAGSKEWIFLITLFPLYILCSVPGIIEYKRYKEYRNELKELYRQEAEDYVKGTWQNLYNRYKYGNAWWEEQQRKKEEEEERKRQNHYYYQQPSYTAIEVTEAYRFLGLSLNSGEAEVKKAYRKLALKYHPDRGGSAEKFKLLVHHKEVLFRYLGVK